MCGSVVDIQSTAAEIRRGKKKEEERRRKKRYSPTKLFDGAQVAIFGDFFASCISSEPRAAGFRPTS